MEEVIMIEYFLEDELNINQAAQIILNDLVRENIIPNRIVPVFNEGYLENIVPNYNFNEIRSHFRMTREDTEELCGLLAPHLPEQHLCITLEKNVLFSL
ncbi:spermatogenesis-associated 4-related [Holotrichia oblita]|uniref:Spermatogenesis-associated 4-related n=1 Tax=Holotrichia oblita TaxID=644536 RepID=A0ACB9SXE7_HOLOL|nr:spermatogenesis-associated 4-related [Holotrichia oblita]